MGALQIGFVLAQGALDPLEFGDVGNGRDQTHHPSGIVELRGVIHQNIALRAAGLRQGDREIHRATGQRFGHERSGLGKGCGADDVDDPLADDVVRVSSIKFGIGAIHITIAKLLIHPGNHHPDMIRDITEPPFALSQRLFRLAAFGHVVKGAIETGRPPVVEFRPADRTHPPMATLRGDEG